MWAHMRPYVILVLLFFFPPITSTESEMSEGEAFVLLLQVKTNQRCWKTSILLVKSKDKEGHGRCCGLIDRWQPGWAEAQRQRHDGEGLLPPKMVRSRRDNMEGYLQDDWTLNTSSVTETWRGKILSAICGGPINMYLHGGFPSWPCILSIGKLGFQIGVSSQGQGFKFGFQADCVLTSRDLRCSFKKGF